MSNPGHIVDRPDPIIEYYKQFVDREALRENLKLTPEERLLKLTEMTQDIEKYQLPAARQTARESIDRLIAIVDQISRSTTPAIVSRLSELRDEIDRISSL